MVVRKTVSLIHGLASGLAGLVVLPYVGMAAHDVLTPSAEVPFWPSFGLFGFMALLCLSALLMSFRFYRRAAADKSETK
jgi:hypothetical protein